MGPPRGRRHEDRHGRARDASHTFLYKSITDYDVVHDHTIIGPFHAERYPGLPVTTTISWAVQRRADRPVQRLAPRGSRSCASPTLSVGQPRSASGPCDSPWHRRRPCSVQGDGEGDDDGDVPTVLGSNVPRQRGAQSSRGRARKAGVRILVAARCASHGNGGISTEYVEPYLGTAPRTTSARSPTSTSSSCCGAPKALLFPIRWNEPFGMVMLEAFASRHSRDRISGGRCPRGHTRRQDRLPLRRRGRNGSMRSAGSARSTVRIAALQSRATSPRIAWWPSTSSSTSR